MKILNKLILIKGVVKKGKIERVDNPSIKTKGEEIEELKVEGVADDVKIGVKVGDSVIIDPKALTNIGYCVNLLFPKKKETEFYVLVKEEDILVIQ